MASRIRLDTVVEEAKGEVALGLTRRMQLALAWQRRVRDLRRQLAARQR